MNTRKTLSLLALAALAVAVGGNHTCVPIEPIAPVCEWNGVGYSVGERFPAGDGCNHCFCDEGGSVACTEMACLPPCDPAEEYWRDYVGESPEICTRIFFVCPEYTAYFANDCGCGCEQSPDCPEWIDCMPAVPPGSPCNDPTFFARCPYTQIVY